MSGERFKNSSEGRSGSACVGGKVNTADEIRIVSTAGVGDTNKHAVGAARLIDDGGDPEVERSGYVGHRQLCEGGGPGGEIRRTKETAGRSAGKCLRAYPLLGSGSPN